MCRRSRNSDGAADGDGISIIRLTGVVSLCGGRRRDFDLARDLSKAETGLLMLVGSKSSGCLPCKGEVAWG
jgi:hypothetical protein